MIKLFTVYFKKKSQCRTQNIDPDSYREKCDSHTFGRTSVYPSSDIRDRSTDNL